MKKIELLAPAGDMDGLKAAVHNGADAVYLGIKQFNARNNIQGFTLDTLSQAVDFAHTFGVKVYLALNILFKDNELQSALDVVADAHNKGVDAFIVQDLGLVYLIRKCYPQIELHASTQMAVHNLEGVKILEKLGFRRVVLARETSKAEIERIKNNSEIEIEFFVQGALCVSFSGNCYMCSHLVGKSGNRGVCQQFCRLPYEFESGNIAKSGFLLSAKDICMIDNIDDLKQLGVASLKIEGRARRAFYVAQACKTYRKALDTGEYSTDDLKNLEMAFNRGYTPAYFNGNANIISQIQGNNGLEIGKVVNVNNGKKFNEVYIKTNYKLQAPSGLKFVFEGKEIASIGARDIKPIGKLYRITTTAKVNAGSVVYIIQDENLEKEILSKTKKLPIALKLIAKENEPLKIWARYGDIEICGSGDVCQRAKTIPISKEQIAKQLSRSEMFEVSKLECELNDCYILNSSINKLRNNIYDELTQKIIKKYQKTPINKRNVNTDLKLIDNLNNDLKNKFNFKIINNLNNLPCVDNLIYDYDNFNIEDVKRLDNYCKANDIKGYIDLPNFATSQDIELISKALKNTSLGIVANNIYALGFDCKMIGGQFLNVYNSYALLALNDLCKLDAMFVEELTNKEIESLQTSLPLLRREKSYMTLLHCPFKQNAGCDCKSCGYQSDATFTINSGKKFSIKRKKTVSCVFMLKD